jgi:DNA-binding GntR family transcriptional regulator
MMHDGDKDLVIYEGKLAKEFGVSRTPVRQVIQSLASESLVEVRSGVGTVATPLLQERRVKDLQSFSSILKACSECTVAGNIAMPLSEIVSLRIYLEQANDLSPNEIFFDVSNRLIHSLTKLVEDQIMRDGLVACYWRYLRRRVAENNGDYNQTLTELVALIRDAEYGAQNGDAERVLRMMSGHIENLSKGLN